MTEKSALSSQPKWRILIVDDHPLVRRGLSELISYDPSLQVCGEADDIGAALQVFDSTSPDLVLVDISLKNGNGLELIRRLKSRNSDCRVLVSSMHDETLYAERSLRAGAMGYINKHEATDKVLDAIHQVLRGDIYVSAHMSHRLLSRVAGGGGSRDDRSPIETLSDRELEVFELIGHGHTTRQIAEKLHLSVKTIETYRENIKNKLKLSTAADLSRHAVLWVLEKA